MHTKHVLFCFSSFCLLPFNEFHCYTVGMSQKSCLYYYTQQRLLEGLSQDTSYSTVIYLILLTNSNRQVCYIYYIYNWVYVLLTNIALSSSGKTQKPPLITRVFYLLLKFYSPTTEFQLLTFKRIISFCEGAPRMQVYLAKSKFLIFVLCMKLFWNVHSVL